ncbi:Uncharacterized protein APZ42_001911, partial [Daphnia magna]
GNQCSYQEFEDIINSSNNSLILRGDLNAHSPSWDDHHPQNKCGRIITDILLNEEKVTLCTPKNLGTRPNPNANRSSTIDLTFASPDIAHLLSITTGAYWGSDHTPIIIEAHINSPPIITANNYWRFSDKKWEEWNNELEKKLTEKNIMSTQETDEAYKIFYSAIIETTTKHFSPNTNIKESNK